MVRVRFAPSPTGYLHIGGARTALFNWLYARRHGGTFVLRIEDTDAERSSWEMVSGIVDGLRWLGLDWDEGPDVGGPHAPYFQSERIAKYRAAAAKLVETGAAYYCYCSAESLQQKRQAAEAAGGGWIDDRTCLSLSADEIARREAEGAPRAVRFKVPDGTTAFDDLVHGHIEFPNAAIEDFVIQRSDAQPTYHLSVVVDDIDMEITHVVRGDDHISNTPKQILLYHALGRPTPQFAHVPLILGPDKKRLSKRHGATSVMEYQRLGYLPEAMLNFLALLGWSPGSGDQELFTREELIAKFTLEGISGGNAVFNPEKLDWVNQQHIGRLTTDDLAGRLRPWLERAGVWSEEFSTTRRAWFLAVVELFKPRIKRLDQFVPEAMPLLSASIDYDPAAVARHLKPEIGAPLDALRDAFASLDAFTAEALEKTLRDLAEARGLKAAALIHATRVAVTGRAASPGLFETLELIGRDRVVERMGEAVRRVSSSA
jgi:glutamyl-tRNA synthetase